MRYADKVVLVTGGSLGIGQGCARGVCGGPGSTVAFCARKQAEGRGARRRGHHHGPWPRRVPALRRVPGKRRSAASWRERGPATAASTASSTTRAGIRPTSRSTTSRPEFRHLLELNLVSIFVACQEALPHLRKTRGNVINCHRDPFVHCSMPLALQPNGQLGQMHPKLLVSIGDPEQWERILCLARTVELSCRCSDRLTSARQLAAACRRHQSHFSRCPPAQHQVSPLWSVGRACCERVHTPSLCTEARRRLGEAHAGGTSSSWTGGYRHQAAADDTMCNPPPPFTMLSTWDECTHLCSCSSSKFMQPRPPMVLLPTRPAQNATAAIMRLRVHPPPPPPGPSVSNPSSHGMQRCVSRSSRCPTQAAKSN